MHFTTSPVRPRLAGALVAAGVASLGCTGSVAPPSSEASTGSAPRLPPSATCPIDHEELVARLDQLEHDRDATVGLYAVDTGTGAELSYRADQRFAFASTIKALAAAVVLDQLTPYELTQRIRWTESDLVAYSPVTEKHVEDGLTVRQVLEAAVTMSDNTAANLMFDLIGGPDSLDQAIEEVGDTTTVVARREPALNDFMPGDVRDTTTPRALASSLAAFALGDELAVADERLLNGLLVRNTTGDDLIRASVPRDWKVGDKTGSARYGTRNDVAVVTPPGRAPVVLAVLTRHDARDAATDDVLVAEAAEVAVDALCQRSG